MFWSNTGPVVFNDNGRPSARLIDAYTNLLSNLLANALKHSREAGEIRVSVDQSSAGTTTIVVKDNGAGIAAEHLPHVFTRFYGARPANSKEPRGAGLGLAIVKAIMTLHQGDVSVQSERGKGTSVTLTFPASA